MTFQRVLIAAVVASAVVIAGVLSVPYLPTHDGPQHLYLAHITNHYADPGSVYAQVYRPTQSLAALGFALVYAPIAGLMEWRHALAVTLAAILLAWSWGCVLLTCAVRRERAILGLLGFAAAFQWALFMGLFSYLLSISVGLFSIALAIRSAPWSPRHRIWIAGLLLVQSVFHAFGGQVTSLFLLVFVLASTERSRWVRELLLLVVMGLPVVAISAYAAGWIGESAPLRPVDTDHGLGFIERARLVSALFVGGPGWRAWPLLVLTAVGIVSCFMRSRLGRTTHAERALGVTSALLLAAGLFAPLDLPHWELFSPRFLPPAAALALPLLPVETLGARWRAVAALAVTTFAASSLVWALGFVRRTYSRCADAFSGLDQPIRRTGLRLPVTLDSDCGAEGELQDEEFPFFRPTANFGALYAIQQGGAVPYTFALLPQLHPFVVRQAAFEHLPPVPARPMFWWVYESPKSGVSLEQRNAITTQVGMEGSFFEDVIFYGQLSDLRVLLDAGYRADYADGRLAILRFEGCPTTVTVRTSARPSAPVLIEYAWFPVAKYLAGARLEPEAWAGSGEGRATLRRAPCGRVLVRVYEDVDGSGSFSDPDVRCVGADRWGARLVTVGASAGELACDLDRAP